MVLGGLRAGVHSGVLNHCRSSRLSREPIIPLLQRNRLTWVTCRIHPQLNCGLECRLQGGVQELKCHCKWCFPQEANVTNWNDHIGVGCWFDSTVSQWFTEQKLVRWYCHAPSWLIEALTKALQEGHSCMTTCVVLPFDQISHYHKIFLPNQKYLYIGHGSMGGKLKVKLEQK